MTDLQDGKQHLGQCVAVSFSLQSFFHIKVTQGGAGFEHDHSTPKKAGGIIGADWMARAIILVQVVDSSNAKVMFPGGNVSLTCKTRVVQDIDDGPI